MSLPRTLANLLILGWICILPATAQQTTQEEKGGFGGDYEQLEPGQKKVVDDWFRRFNEIAEQHLKPAEGYNRISTSVKTTFDAVTHALLGTQLTNESGDSLGTALDLVAQVETVRGKVRGARGDRQFRMYVGLKPNALEILKECQEFSRGGDNTIFHKGYPINYRQQGGVPSIQFSVSGDEKRADIDVDYRSSKFPVGLFNGHLSSSNSDVRAGNNDQRHNNRWAGLNNWWRSLFGLPVQEVAQEPEEKDHRLIPEFPRVKGKSKPVEAVYDFLNSWLVEQQPNLAAAYFSDRVFACLELKQGEAVDRGMAPFILLKGMRAVNKELGKRSSLKGTIVGVRLKDPELKVVEQPHNGQFVLFDVPNNVAATFECANRLHPEEALRKRTPPKRYGKYFGAVFKIEAPRGSSEVIALLWTKEKRYWKLVSYEVEVVPGFDDVPDLTQASAPLPAVKLETVDGDPALIRATRDFHQKWLVKKRYRKALNYLAPACYGCVNLFLEEGQEKVTTAEQAKKSLLNGLKEIGDLVGKVRGLGEAIETIDPQVSYIKLVEHDHKDAFLLANIPDWMAEAGDCAKRAAGAKFPENYQGPHVFGSYYGTGFQLKQVSGDPAVLYLLWAKVDGDWKITAYDLVTP